MSVRKGYVKFLGGPGKFPFRFHTVHAYKIFVSKTSMLLAPTIYKGGWPKGWTYSNSIPKLVLCNDKWSMSSLLAILSDDCPV